MAFFVSSSLPGASQKCHRLLRIQHTLHLQQAQYVPCDNLGCTQHRAVFPELIRVQLLTKYSSRSSPSASALASLDVPLTSCLSRPFRHLRVESRTPRASRDPHTSNGSAQLPLPSPSWTRVVTFHILRTSSVLCTLHDVADFNRSECLASAFLPSPQCSLCSASTPASTTS